MHHRDLFAIVSCVGGVKFRSVLEWLPAVKQLDKDMMILLKIWELSQRYEDSLIKQREKKAEKPNAEKRGGSKREKKIRLESDFTHLELEIEKAATEAETTSNPLYFHFWVN